MLILNKSMKKLANIFYWVLSKRYSITIKGEEVIKKNGPKIYLPNHQAEVDPIVLLTVIQQYHKAAPMVSAAYYNIPVFKQFLDILGTVPVSDLDLGVRDANVMQHITKAANTAFSKGDSILLYPSGHLCSQGYEKVENKQSAYNIVKSSPDNLNIVGVRMSGFWGSIWSRAWMGKSPGFTKVFLISMMWWFLNLIFFIPKRNIVFEFFDITEEAKYNAKNLKRREFNEFLEKIYNENGEEKIRYIRHHFLAPKLKRKVPKRIKGVVSNNLNDIEFKEIDL